MLKRYLVILLGGLFMFTTSYFYKSPVFMEKGNYEIYFGDSASILSPLKINIKDFYKLRNIRGESFSIKKSQFNLKDFLSKYNAEIKFTERTNSTENYYCYSKDIKYRERVNGNVINIHISVGDELIKVGTPIIYGSF